MKENHKGKKLRKILMGLIYAALIIGAIQFLFDSDPFNDIAGSGFLLLFWFIRMVDSSLKNLADGQKNLAMLNIGLSIIAGIAVAATWVTYFFGI